MGDGRKEVSVQLFRAVLYCDAWKTEEPQAGEQGIGKDSPAGSTATEICQDHFPDNPIPVIYFIFL